MAVIRIPRLATPFTTTPSPFIERAEASCRDYQRAFGLVTEECSARYYAGARQGEWASRVYPSGDWEGLKLAAEFMGTAVVYDDQIRRVAEERGVAAAARVNRVVLEWLLRDDATGPSTVGKPFAPALADLWNRIRARMSPEWQLRFADSVGHYFEGALLHFGGAEKQVPGLDDLQAARREGTGMNVCLSFIEITGGYQLPTALLRTELWQQHHEAVVDIVMWTNDIYTLEFDLARGDGSNIVRVLRKQNGGTLQDAAEAAADMFHARLADLLRIEEQLPALLDGTGLSRDARANVTRYVAETHHMIQGNIVWSEGLAGRYSPSADPYQDCQPNFLTKLALQIAP